MALNDNALFTAATGYVYTGAVGVATKPTPAQIAAFNPADFNSEKQTVTITGTPTGGTFTLTSGGQTTAAIAYNATASAVQAALVALSSIGAGNVTVTGGPGPATPYVVNFIGTLSNSNPAQMTATASLTGGTVPAVTVTTSTPWPGWTDLGHTSREDLPEFGFDGGDTETRGTWRNAALREVVTEAAVDYVNIRLHQFDDEGLGLYYGQTNSSLVKGEFAVADTSTSTVERALTMVVVDGLIRIALYAPRVSIRRDDSIELSTDEFSVLPLRATFLKRGTDPIFTWINSDTLNPSGT